MDRLHQQEDERTNLAQQFFLLQNFANILKSFWGYNPYKEDECTNLAQQFFLLRNFANMLKSFWAYDRHKVSFEIFWNFLPKK